MFGCGCCCVNQRIGVLFDQSYSKEMIDWTVTKTFIFFFWNKSLNADDSAWLSLSLSLLHFLCYIISRSSQSEKSNDESRNWWRQTYEKENQGIRTVFTDSYICSVDKSDSRECTEKRVTLIYFLLHLRIIVLQWFLRRVDCDKIKK
jgi:hypothetical protein